MPPDIRAINIKLNKADDQPGHNDDPFDRMLIAQAHTEGLTLISEADATRRYDVPLFTA